MLFLIPLAIFDLQFVVVLDSQLAPSSPVCIDSAKGAYIFLRLGEFSPLSGNDFDGLCDGLSLVIKGFHALRHEYDVGGLRCFGQAVIFDGRIGLLANA